MTARLVFPAILFAAAACGSADVALGTSAAIKPMDASSADAPPERSLSPPRKPAPKGSIARADLDAQLTRGPAALLSEVETEPRFTAGRFVGFCLVSFSHGSPKTVDLRPGDIILKVNGQQLERPEHFISILDLLRKAPALQIDLLRNGAQLKLSYPIVD